MAPTPRSGRGMEGLDAHRRMARITAHLCMGEQARETVGGCVLHALRRHGTRQLLPTLSQLDPVLTPLATVRGTIVPGTTVRGTTVRGTTATEHAVADQGQGAPAFLVQGRR